MNYYTVKTRIFTLLFTVFGYILGAHAQNKIELLSLEPTEDFENVWVHKLADGEEATSFLIWVKSEVPPHYHGTHAEHIYILAGTGTMQLGDEELTVKTGDFLRIPPNSVHAVQVTSQEPLKVLSIQTPQFMGEDRHWVEQ